MTVSFIFPKADRWHYSAGMFIVPIVDKNVRFVIAAAAQFTEQWW